MNTFVSAEQWHIPEYIHPLFHDGGVVYFNSKLGTWGVRNRLVGWLMLEGAGAIDDMELTWPELDAGKRPPVELLPHLAAASLLSPGPKPEGRSTYPYALLPPGVEETVIGSVTMVRGDVTQVPVPPGMLSSAQACIDQSLCLIRTVKEGSQPFTTVMETVRSARGDSAQPATIEQATQIAEVVRQTGDSYFSKVACLERALGVVLLGAQQGLDISLHMGAGVDPIDFHAWPAAQGQPVSLEYDATITGRFYSVLQF